MSYKLLQQDECDLDLYANSITLGGQLITADKIKFWSSPDEIYNFTGAQGDPFEVVSTVSTYSSLPSTGIKNGKGVYVQDSGKVYIYNNNTWPTESQGLQWRGPTIP